MTLQELMAQDMFVRAIVESCIKVCGEDNWNGYSEQKKHDMVMGIVKVALSSLEKLEESK